MDQDAGCLFIGLVLLVKGGGLFVAAAVRLAELWRLPRVVVGSTLVSLTTTLPELTVSLVAAWRGEPGLAIGNAVGSVICNIALILGLASALRPIQVQLRGLALPLAVMFAAGGALFVMGMDGVVSRGQGVLLIAGGAVWFAFDFLQHWRARSPAGVGAEAVAVPSVPAGRSGAQTAMGAALLFCVAAGLVVFGSKLLVDGAVGLAHGLGIPTVLIGLTVVAVGTSLPELITAVTASRRSVGDLAIGNILGANIANLLFIVGAAAAVNGVPLDRLTQRFSFPAMLVIMVVLVAMLLSDRRLSRREGWILLLLYWVYLATLFVLGAAPMT